MDSLEIAKLQREVNILEQKKNALNETVDNLSKENLKYLEAIPKSKAWAEEQQALAEETRKKTVVVIDVLNTKNQSLKDINNSIQEANVELETLKKSHAEELKSLIGIKQELENKTQDLKKREIALRDLQSLVESKQLINSENGKTIAEAASKLLNDKEEFNKECSDFEMALSEFNKKEADFEKKSALFEENKKTYFNQQEELAFKLNQAKDLVSENAGLQANLLDQQKRLDIEVSKALDKQESLERNIKDLDNREKALDIRELRIKKMAYDAGLQKEHAELTAELSK